MARIAGVNIPTNKRVVIALRYIHGIGPVNAVEICDKVGIDHAKRVNQLTESNPERAKEINEEIRQMDAKRSADQLGDECEAYDKRLQQIEQAEREADIPPADTQR